MNIPCLASTLALRSSTARQTRALPLCITTHQSAPTWRAKLEDDPGPTIVTMRSLAASESVARANKQKAPTSP